MFERRHLQIAMQPCYIKAQGIVHAAIQHDDSKSNQTPRNRIDQPVKLILCVREVVNWERIVLLCRQKRTGKYCLVSEKNKCMRE